MKTENVFIQGLKREIVFHIGVSKNDNFNVIDAGNPHDLWFHAKDESSCHVVGVIPEDITDKKELKYIIRTGALLCKNNTKKLKTLQHIEIIYTQIKNIEKTKIQGCVLTSNTKTIVC